MNLLAIEIGGKRFIPLPGYEGRVDRIPVRSIEAGYEEYRGVEIGTEWDLFALAGIAPVAVVVVGVVIAGNAAWYHGIGAKARERRRAGG